MVSPTAPTPPTDADFVVVMDGVDHTVGMVTLDDCPMTVGRGLSPPDVPGQDSESRPGRRRREGRCDIGVGAAVQRRGLRCPVLELRADGNRRDDAGVDRDLVVRRGSAVRPLLLDGGLSRLRHECEADRSDGDSENHREGSTHHARGPPRTTNQSLGGDSGPGQLPPLRTGSAGDQAGSPYVERDFGQFSL